MKDSSSGRRASKQLAVPTTTLPAFPAWWPSMSDADLLKVLEDPGSFSNKDTTKGQPSAAENPQSPGSHQLSATSTSENSNASTNLPPQAPAPARSPSPPPKHPPTPPYWNVPYTIRDRPPSPRDKDAILNMRTPPRLPPSPNKPGPCQFPSSLSLSLRQTIVPIYDVRAPLSNDVSWSDEDEELHGDTTANVDVAAEEDVRMESPSPRPETPPVVDRKGKGREVPQVTSSAPQGTVASVSEPTPEAVSKFRSKAHEEFQKIFGGQDPCTLADPQYLLDEERDALASPMGDSTKLPEPHTQGTITSASQSSPEAASTSQGEVRDESQDEVRDEFQGTLKAEELHTLGDLQDSWDAGWESQFPVWDGPPPQSYEDCLNPDGSLNAAIFHLPLSKFPPPELPVAHDAPGTSRYDPIVPAIRGPVGPNRLDPAIHTGQAVVAGPPPPQLPRAYLPQPPRAYHPAQPHPSIPLRRPAPGWIEVPLWYDNGVLRTTQPGGPPRAPDFVTYKPVWPVMRLVRRPQMQPPMMPSMVPPMHPQMRPQIAHPMVPQVQPPMLPPTQSQQLFQQVQAQRQMQGLLPMRGRGRGQPGFAVQGRGQPHMQGWRQPPHVGGNSEAGPSNLTRRNSVV